MKFHLAPQHGFILAHLTGLVSPEAWEQVLEQLEDAIQPLPHDRMLLDLTGLVGFLGEPERRAVGTCMAARFARMTKVALVVQAAKITGVVQAEAQARGLDLRLFPEHDAAVAWVLS